jgi:putative spermidine/putrescine transport system ATP-binding protein
VAGVRIEGLSKSFSGHTVLDIDSLTINDGEFFALLGPSGCGKTTTLRSIAGLADPDRGRIIIGERDVTSVPTFERNLGMVFQRYALFPHLTVTDNVAYGLIERRITHSDARIKAAEALALVGLPDFGARYPHQLSGGEQQRVALARAIVYRPDVLLLDEPLSNLDAKLRVTMRAELKRLHWSLALTTVFVTHDQQEALALSDRIAVMRDGRIEQIGTPSQIYEQPASTYVADFVGATNLLRDDAGSTIAIKPERVRLGPATGVDEPGVIVAVAYLGSAYSYLISLRGQQIEARMAQPFMLGGRAAASGDTVAVIIDPRDARVFP